MNFKDHVGTYGDSMGASNSAAPATAPALPRADQPAFPQLAGMSAAGAACGMTMREHVAIEFAVRKSYQRFADAWKDADDFLAADPRKAAPAGPTPLPARSSLLSEVIARLVSDFYADNGIDLAKNDQALRRIIVEARRVSDEFVRGDAVSLASLPFICANENGPLHLNGRYRREEFVRLPITAEPALAADILAVQSGLTPIPEETVADIRSRLGITEEPCTHIAHHYDGEHEPAHESCPDCGGVGSVQVQAQPITLPIASIHTDGNAIAAAFGDGAFASEEEDAALVAMGREIWREWIFNDCGGLSPVGATAADNEVRCDDGEWRQIMIPRSDRLMDGARALYRRVQRERDAQEAGRRG